MTNIIERTLETLAFALLVAGAVGFWFVTPANAWINRGETGESCYETSDGHGGTYYRCE